MPCAKYYRSVLPTDLLQLIGDFAGDELYKLIFTLSEKRGFLSNILLVWRDPELYSPRKSVCILKPKHWIPVRLGCIAEVLVLIGEKTTLQENIVVPSLKRITDILLEIHDWKLRRIVKKVW
jgi:hypothetical protein